MMTLAEPTITCPECKAQIRLTDTLAAPLIADAQSKLATEREQMTADFSKREAALLAQGVKVADAQSKLDLQVAERVELERTKIEEQAKAHADRTVAAQLATAEAAAKAAKDELAENTSKLEEAQKAQVEFMRKTRELDDAKREIDLTIERRLGETLVAERAKAKEDGERGMQLKVREKEEQLAAMQRQIEDLKRKAEQGSQQLQGEVQELELESILRRKFPHDIIEPVPKGEFGGDLLQRVVSPSGQTCGSILWEAKRTRNWSDGWLTKLRDDQRAAGANVALIVSHALPKGTQSFDLIDGVWVADPNCAVPVAIAIRQTLIQVEGARVAGEGQQTKTEMVYNYLTGPRFKHRVEAIVERFTEMQADLARERKAMTRMWSKRELQINGVIEATAGMYGDLQGIVGGRSLAEIEGLELPLLDAPEPVGFDDGPLTDA